MKLPGMPVLLAHFSVFLLFSWLSASRERPNCNSGILEMEFARVEIDNLIKAAIAETGAGSMQDMGKVMGKLKAQVQGRADMGAVSGKIKALLTA